MTMSSRNSSGLANIFCISESPAMAVLPPLSLSTNLGAVFVSDGLSLTGRAGKSAESARIESALDFNLLLST